MDAEKIIQDFRNALRLAGMTPQDFSPVLGVHTSSLYRILAGRTPTSPHMLRSLQMATVFLHWASTRATLKDSPVALFLHWVES